MSDTSSETRPTDAGVAAERGVAEHAAAERLWYQQVAGLLLFGMGSAVLLGIVTAEALYPGYSTATNAISDLGATPAPPDRTAAAAVFNATMTAAGVGGLAAAYAVHRGFRRRSLTVPFALFGVGVLGVGVFNVSFGPVHVVFALLAFVFGAVSAISAAQVQDAPVRYLSVVLGAVPLIDLGTFVVLGSDSPFLVLGFGGLERWIAYPILLWSVGFGGYLLGRVEDHRTGD